MNRKNVTAFGSILTATALCAYTLVPATALADDGTTTDTSSDSAVSTLATAINAPRDTTSDSSAEQTSKEETVYVFSKADGAVKNLIVSDWLKNPLKLDTLNDRSELADIENVDGDETFTQTGNSLSWAAGGDDIYYQGSIEKDLPVTVKVTYYLDGQKISADDLAGKSGKVTIRFDYTNNQYTMKDISGTQTKIYTPFVAMTGLVLDNANFSNVTVNNGKVINDGDRTIAAGYALPGMQDNLGVGKDVVDVPDYVEITADATDFQLDTTVTMVTSDLLDDIDTEDISTDTVKDSLDELQSAMSQLTSGSSQLYDGLVQIADGATAVDSGTQQLSSGSTQLSSGTAKLASSTSGLASSASELNDGEQALAAGLSTAVTGTDQLIAGDGALQSGLDALKNGGKTSSGKTSAGLSGAVAALGDASTDGTLINGATQISGGLAQVVGTKGATSASSSGLYKAQVGAQELSAGAQSAVDGIGTGLSDTNPTLLKGADAVQAYVAGAKTALVGDGSASSMSASSLLTSASGALGDSGATGALTAATSSLSSIGDPMSTAATDLGTASSNLGTASSDLGTASTKLNAASSALDAVSDSSDADAALSALKSIEGDTTLTDTEKQAISKAEDVLSSESAAAGAASSAKSAASTASSSADTAAGSADTAASSAGTAASSAGTAAKAVGTSSAYISGAQQYVTGASQAVGGAQQYVAGAAGALDSANATDQAVISGLKTMSTQLTAAKTGADAIASGLSDTAPGAIFYLNQINLGSQKLSYSLNILKNGSSTSTGLVDAVNAVGTASDTGSDTLYGGTNQLKAGLTQLKGDDTSGLVYASNGASALAAGTKQLAETSPALVSGIQQIDSGASTLSNGLGTLAANTPTLASGAQTAMQGSKELADGLQEFDEQGVQKLVDYYDDNLSELADRVKATVDSGNEYGSFSGVDSSMTSSVKFIYETDAIGEDDN